MSTKYYLRDAELNKKYDAFNRELSAIKEQVLQMISAIKVDEDLAWAKEDLLKAANENVLVEGARHDYEKFFIGTSTAKSFYWRDDNGFTGLASVQKVMEENPHLVITDEYQQDITFEAFQDIVSLTKKSQLSFDTGNPISPASSMSAAEMEEYIKQQKDEIQECNYSIDGLCRTMKSLGVPQSEWGKNVMVKEYLRRIDLAEKNLKHVFIGQKSLDTQINGAKSRSKTNQPTGKSKDMEPVY